MIRPVGKHYDFLSQPIQKLEVLSNYSEYNLCYFLNDLLEVRSSDELSQDH
jgi:hypothetical protein